MSDHIVDATLRDLTDAGDLSTATAAGLGLRSGGPVGPDISARPGIADLEAADFAVVLLQALTTMAMRSKRRQADLTAALHGAGLPADPPRVRAALRLLQTQGAIENLVPLFDGGLLLSVTLKGTARIAPSPQWLPLEELDATAG